MAERLVKVRLVLEGKEYDAGIVAASGRTKDALEGAGRVADQNVRPAIGRLGAAVAMSGSQLSSLGATSDATGRALTQLGPSLGMLMATGFSPLGLAIAGVSAGLGFLVGSMRDSNAEAKKLEEQTRRNQQEFEKLTDRTNDIVEALNRFKGIEGTSSEAKSVVDALRQRREIQTQISDLIRHQTELEMEEKTETIEYKDLTQKINDLLDQRMKLALATRGVSKQTTQDTKELLSFMSDPFASLGTKTARDREAEKAAETRAKAQEEAALKDWRFEQRLQAGVIDSERKWYDARLALLKKFLSGKAQAQKTWDDQQRDNAKWLHEESEKEEKENAERILRERIEKVMAFADAAGTAGAMFSEFASIAAEGSKLQTALVVGSILMEAAVKSAMQIAEGLAAAANPLMAWTAPIHFAAAAAFAAVGAVKGVQAAAGGGGGGGASGGTGSRQYVPQQETKKQETARYVIVVQGNQYLSQDAERELAGMVERHYRRQSPGAARGL